MGCRNGLWEQNKAFSVSTKFQTRIVGTVRSNDWKLAVKTQSSLFCRHAAGSSWVYPCQAVGRHKSRSYHWVQRGRQIGFQKVHTAFLFVCIVKGAFQDKDCIFKTHFRREQIISDDWDKGIMNSQLTSCYLRASPCCSQHMGQNVKAGSMLSGHSLKTKSKMLHITWQNTSSFQSSIVNFNIHAQQRYPLDCKRCGSQNHTIWKPNFALSTILYIQRLHSWLRQWWRHIFLDRKLHKYNLKIKIHWYASIVHLTEM